MFSQIATVVEALLANGAAIASRCFVLLVGMFSDVMPLELVSSVKVSIAHLTQKAARLVMNGLSVPLQGFLTIERLGAKVADGPLPVPLGRRNRRGQQRQVNKSLVRRTSHSVRLQVSL